MKNHAKKEFCQIYLRNQQYRIKYKFKIDKLRLYIFKKSFNILYLKIFIYKKSICDTI